MAEYVCDMTDDYPDVPYGSDEYSDTVERREGVVRCRDCAHAIRLEGEPAEARPGMLNCVTSRNGTTTTTSRACGWSSRTDSVLGDAGRR